MLNDSQLEAFYTVAMEGSFTRASEILHLSQPALSRRLQSLEETVEFTLFDRTPQGVELTEAGKKLLMYVKNKKALEQDALLDIRGEARGSLSGLIRIASNSSILEQVVMPALAPFLLDHPQVQVEFSVKPNSVLDEMLNYSKTDIIISNLENDRKDVVQFLMGEEEFICIESSTLQGRSHVYLDANPNDTTTEDFFKNQANAPKKIHRSFMHDENGILKGVQLGLGRAIKPRHTLKELKNLKIVRGFTSLKKPVYLRHSKKQFFTRLEKSVIEVLQKEIPKFFK